MSGTRSPRVFVEQLLASGLSRGTPLLLASVGEILAERSGVMNLGLEGMMLLGAAAGYAVGYLTGSLILGVLAAMLAAGAVAAAHGAVTVLLAGDQIISGLGLGFFAGGLASVVGFSYVGQPGGPRFEAMELSLLSRLPILGPALFAQSTVVYLGLLVVALSWIYLYRTRFGLTLRAAGEAPAAADAQGLAVRRARLLHVGLGGTLAGLAGSTLSLGLTPGWVEGMTSGQGWIALGLTIFSGWNPLRAALGSYLFGALARLPLDLQGIASLPFARNPNLGYFLDMLPYVFTIVVLIRARTRRLHRPGAPAALGQPFIRGERGR